MDITIATATRFEIKEELFKAIDMHRVSFLYTGVGLLASAVSIMQHALQQKPGLLIQAGIAGSFNEQLLSAAVVVKNDCTGDMGVMEKDGWKNVFDMGFAHANDKPYENSMLPNPWLQKLNNLALPEVNSVTVNEVTTSLERIHLLQTKYYAQTESMEGASLHYVCRLLGIPFLQVRGISNKIGERDKGKWRIKEAVQNVNETIISMINAYPPGIFNNH